MIIYNDNKKALPVDPFYHLFHSAGRTGQDGAPEPDRNGLELFPMSFVPSKF